MSGGELNQTHFQFTLYICNLYFIVLGLILGWDAAGSSSLALGLLCWVNGGHEGLAVK